VCDFASLLVRQEWGSLHVSYYTPALFLAKTLNFSYQTHVTVISISRARGTCSKPSLAYPLLEYLVIMAAAN